MERSAAIELARRCAQAKPQAYYVEPFEPHEWVIDAIMEAATGRGEAVDRAKLEKLRSAVVYESRNVGNGDTVEIDRDERMTVLALVEAELRRGADDMAAVVGRVMVDLWRAIGYGTFYGKGDTLDGAVARLLNRYAELVKRIEEVAGHQRAWRNWSDELAPPFGSTRDRDDDAQRLEIKTKIERQRTQIAEQDKTITKLCEDKERLQKVCENQLSELGDALSARDALFLQLLEFKKATMLDPPNDDWGRLTPDHLRQHIQDLADAAAKSQRYGEQLDSVQRQYDAERAKLEEMRNRFNYQGAIIVESHQELDRLGVETSPDETVPSRIRKLGAERDELKQRSDANSKIADKQRDQFVACHLVLDGASMGDQSEHLIDRVKRLARAYSELKRVNDTDIPQQSKEIRELRSKVDEARESAKVAAREAIEYREQLSTAEHKATSLAEQFAAAEHQITALQETLARVNAGSYQRVDIINDASIALDQMPPIVKPHVQFADGQSIGDRIRVILTAFAGMTNERDRWMRKESEAVNDHNHHMRAWFDASGLGTPSPENLRKYIATLKGNAENASNMIHDLETEAVQLRKLKLDVIRELGGEIPAGLTLPGFVRVVMDRRDQAIDALGEIGALTGFRTSDPQIVITRVQKLVEERGQLQLQDGTAKADLSIRLGRAQTDLDAILARVKTVLPPHQHNGTAFELVGTLVQNYQEMADEMASELDPADIAGMDPETTRALLSNGLRKIHNDHDPMADRREDEADEDEETITNATLDAVVNATADRLFDWITGRGND